VHQYGTLASKTLRESALFLSGAKARQLYGIDTRMRNGVTLEQLMYRKNLVRDRERERARHNLDRHRVDLITGHATLLDPHTVALSDPASGCDCEP
jgi:NAD(P) transhydrogenase